ncbi:hypothetical protein DRQ25_12900, partial [Candidatus Fermentibacteria bacterium]
QPNQTSKYYSISISDGAHDYELFENTTAQLETNTLILKITGLAFGKLHTVINIQYPEILKGNNQFWLDTTFAGYSLFKAQNYTVAGATTHCVLHEQEDFEQSTVDCCVSLPYDIDVEETLLLIPRRDFNWHETLQRNALESWERRFHSQVMWKNIFLSLLILITVVILFIKFSPEYFYRY